MNARIAKEKASDAVAKKAAREERGASKVRAAQLVVGELRAMIATLPQGEWPPLGRGPGKLQMKHITGVLDAWQVPNKDRSKGTPEVRAAQARAFLEGPAPVMRSLEDSDREDE
jgi:hypothetical protein